MICQQEEQDRADEKPLTQDVIVARQLDFSRTACRGVRAIPTLIHAFTPLQASSLTDEDGLHGQ